MYLNFRAKNGKNLTLKCQFWRENSNIFLIQTPLLDLNFRAKNRQNRIVKYKHQFWRENSNISNFDNFALLI